MCKKNTNFQYLVTKLHILKVVSCKQTSTLISTVVCNAMSKECMYRNCIKCKDNCITIVNDDKMEDESFYYKWVTKKRKKNRQQG